MEPPTTRIGKMPNFPEDCTEKELKNLTKELAEETALHMTHPFIPTRNDAYIKLIENELFERNTKRAEKNSKRQFWASAMLSGAAIVLSVVSVYLQIQSDKQDEEWQKQEVELLQKIHDAVSGSRLGSEEPSTSL